jgi:hypothetical protein
MSRSRPPKGLGRGRQQGGRDYEAGYGRPPVATRFRPGGVGNPKGRPKKPPSSPGRRGYEARRPRQSPSVAVQKSASFRDTSISLIGNCASHCSHIGPRMSESGHTAVAAFAATPTAV